MAGQPPGRSRPGWQVAGFPVRVRWPAYVLFAVLAWVAATGVLPAAVPGASGAAYAAAGLLAAAGLFAGLLAHELAHAVVARRHGVQVDAISFWLLGGAAESRVDAPTPTAEWRIAAAGPAASVAGAAGCAGLAAGLHGLGVVPLLAAVAGYLAVLQIVVAVFNLLPGAPLDGGRILRAWRWHRTGDRVAATVTAGRAGQVLGALLLVGGGVELLVLAAGAGVWTALIGMFVFAAASTEVRSARVQSALAGLTVADALGPRPDWRSPVPAWQTVAAVLDPAAPPAALRSVIPLRGFDGSVTGLVTFAQLSAVPAADRATVPLRRLAGPAAGVAVTTVDEPLVELLPRLSRPTHPAALPVLGHAVVVHPHAPSHHADRADAADPRPPGEPALVTVLTPSDLSRAVALGSLLHTAHTAAAASTPTPAPPTPPSGGCRP